MLGKFAILIYLLVLLSACSPTPSPVTIPPTSTVQPASTDTPFPTSTETSLPTPTRTSTPIPKPTLENFPFGTFQANYEGSVLIHTFNAEGTWNARLDNQHLDGGTFTINGFQIEIYATGCQFAGLDHKGTYTWSFDGETLTFKKVTDNCDPRTLFLQRKHFIQP